MTLSLNLFDRSEFDSVQKIESPAVCCQKEDVPMTDAIHRLQMPQKIQASELDTIKKKAFESTPKKNFCTMYGLLVNL